MSRFVPGLSAKLLLLTILFVMLAEVLVFVPSVSNFRRQWLMERLAAAQIASLAAEAAPGGQLPPMLRDELLERAQVKAIAVKRAGPARLIIEMDMPAEIDASYDLRDASWLTLIADALMVYVDAGRPRHPGDRRSRLSSRRVDRGGDGRGAAEGRHDPLRPRHSRPVHSDLDHHRGARLSLPRCAAGETDDQAHLEHRALLRAPRGPDQDHRAFRPPRRDRHRRARALRHAEGARRDPLAEERGSRRSASR